jgi:hypothetical protein
MPSLRTRVDSRHRIFRSLKSSVNQSLAAFFSAPSCSEDMLKLRSERGSRKARIGDFSTFSNFACGGEWKTQRFIGFDIEGRNQAPGSPENIVQSGKSGFANIAKKYRCG